jgi:hypothetical protein
MTTSATASVITIHFRLVFSAIIGRAIERAATPEA